MNYAKLLPRDIGGAAMQQFATPLQAVAQIVSTNAVASSIWSLSQHTTIIEIGTQGAAGACIRWVAATENASVAGYHGSVIASMPGANFDHYIPPNTVRRFVIPKETQGVYAGGIGSINGLYQKVAWVNAGATAGSIIASEF